MENYRKLNIFEKKFFFVFNSAHCAFDFTFYHSDVHFVSISSLFLFLSLTSLTSTIIRRQLRMTGFFFTNESSAGH